MSEEMNDMEKQETPETGPEQTSVMPEPEPADAGGKGEDTRKRRRIVAAGIAAAVLVAGLVGAAVVGASNEPVTPYDPPTAADEHETASEQEILALLPTLSFAGQDVSVAEGDVEVVAEGGHVMVTETVPANSDAGQMVEQGAKRSAALMAAVSASQESSASVDAAVSASQGQGGEKAPDVASKPPVTDVTYVVTDPDGKVQVAVTNKADSPAVEEAKKNGSDASAADVVKGSDGWTMTGDCHDKLPDDMKVDQSGGNVPTTPSGDQIVPGEAVPEPEPAEPEAPASPDGGASSGDASDAGAAKADHKADGPSAGSSSATSGSGSGNSQASSGSAAAGQPSSPSQAQEKKWVQDSAAWDEPIYESQPVYEKKWVQDSAAWDEPIYETHSYVYCTGCGSTFSNGNEWDVHNYNVHGGQSSYSINKEKVQVGTRRHDATGHYENVQVGTKKVQVGTRHHDATGHWE